MPSNAANQHDADEGRGPRPQRPAAFQRGPQADRDHHRDVVETAERMRGAGGE